MRKVTILGVALLSACAPKQAQLERPSLLEAADRAVRIEPEGALGTLANPVRAAGPFGQHEFLARARCPDGSVPESERLGSGPTAADGHIVDTYIVHCGPAGPTVMVVMDMYHEGYRETERFGPFEVLRELPAKVAAGCPPRVVADPDSSSRYVFSPFEVERQASILGGEPQPHTVGTAGRAWVSFVVDTLGAPELNSILIKHIEPVALQPHVPNAIRSLRFRPAMHHEGCIVRQRVEGPITFR